MQLMKMYQTSFSFLARVLETGVFQYLKKSGRLYSSSFHGIHGFVDFHGFYFVAQTEQQTTVMDALFPVEFNYFYYK